MAQKILKLESVKQCNKQMGCATCHPLASVVDFSKERLSQYSYIKCDFYAVLLLERSACATYYGRHTCDYADGTMVFLEPKECFEIDFEECDSCFSDGKMLVFHKDLIEGTSTNRHFDDDYSFFRYRDNESLHISAHEKRQVYAVLEDINQEIHHDIDRFTKPLIARHIELLFDYCRRFYERQFILRHDENETFLKKLNQKLATYINDGKLKSQGIPNTDFWADALKLSPAYFDDMLKHETGANISEYIEQRLFETAKDWILEGQKSIDEITEKLGYPNLSYFNNLFKKISGYLPNEYRIKVN